MPKNFFLSFSLNLVSLVNIGVCYDFNNPQKLVNLKKNSKLNCSPCVGRRLVVNSK